MVDFYTLTREVWTHILSVFTSRAAAESYVTLRSALLRRLARRRRGRFAFVRLNAYESI